MRYLLITIYVLFLGTMLFADCDVTKASAEVTGEYKIDTATPAWLRGATITVTQADGKTSTVPAEKYKVVPRKQQFITKEVTKSETLMCEDARKNRVSVIAGKGVKEGIKVTSSPGMVSAESQVGFVGGLQYQRKLGKTFSLGVQGQTNKTVSGMLGIDF